MVEVEEMVTAEVVEVEETAMVKEEELGAAMQ